MRRFAVLFLLLVLVPDAGGTTRAPSGATVVEFSFPSHALRMRMHFSAYLPSGYVEDGLRYPVVYFLHGLPAGPNAYKDVGWLRSALDSLAPGVILVAPQGSSKENVHPTGVTGTRALDLGTSARNTAANVHAFVTTLRKDERARPTFFAFYVGAKDTRFRAENVQLARELTRAGVEHLFAVYPGAHERTVWSAHARAWLGLAASDLAQAR